MPAARRLFALAIVFALLPAVPAGAAREATVGPLRMTDIRPFVPVTVNGKRFDFIVDTGGVDAISAQAAAELGLHVTAGTAVSGGNAAPIASGETVVDAFSVGSIVLRGAKFAVADFSAVAAHIGVRRFDGIVGYEFLRAHAVTF